MTGSTVESVGEIKFQRTFYPGRYYGMIKKILSVSFILLFCLAALSYAGECWTKGRVRVGNMILEGFTLAGSKQGSSIGFVDVDGDGIDDKIIGAPYADSLSNVGALLVYKGDSRGGFSQCPTLVLTGDDNYGFSFINLGDVDGDGREDFALGAIHGDGPEASLSGSVTVYKGGMQGDSFGGGGRIIAQLSGEGPMDKFGLSLAAGDLNGDGVNDLIVGAPFNTDDPALYQGGAMYVYFGPDFVRSVVLRASTLNTGLGWSAAAGDINGDGIADLCISASGKVLCYYGGSEFNPSINGADVIIKSASSGFGKALAIIGDLNGDGFGEILIGAPNAVINGNSNTGSLYIVKGGTGKRTINLDGPSSDLTVRIDGAALFDRFGFSIAPLGDIDGDGKADFAVGAPLADAGALRLAGKVYFFKGKDIRSSATLADSTVFEGFARSQGYGTSLAAAENGRLLIGSPRTNADTGSVSMVDLVTGQKIF